MMLAAKYTNQDPTGWLMSEKLDGWRAFWDGYTLRTRTWRPIYAPEEITAFLPKGIALDGELWAGRGGFLTMQAIGNVNRPSDPRWAGVKFMVFDCPSTLSVPLEERLMLARKLAAGKQVGFVEQVRVDSTPSMWSHFRHVVSNGGEGLVLRRPGSFYEFERSTEWLKVKPCNVD